MPEVGCMTRRTWMKRLRFKPNRTAVVHAVIGMEDGELCIFGIYLDSYEAYESRDYLVSERSALVRRTLETTSRITQRPLIEKNLRDSDSAIDKNYRVIELELDNPGKQIIWRLE